MAPPSAELSHPAHARLGAAHLSGRNSYWQFFLTLAMHRLSVFVNSRDPTSACRSGQREMRARTDSAVNPMTGRDDDSTTRRRINSRPLPRAHAQPPGLTDRKRVV